MAPSNLRPLRVAWVAVSAAIALAASARLSQPADMALLRQAEEDARRGAYALAFERITGERLSAPVAAESGTADAGLLPAAVEANIQRYLEIRANPDEPLRAELARVERESERQIRRARISERVSYWGLALVMWVPLWLAVRAIGAAVVHARRVF
jgi:hypothetical protein